MYSRALTLLLCLPFLILSTYAQSAALQLNMVVDGQPYPATLHPQAFAHSMSPAHAQQRRAQHYRGTLDDQPRSWVRISRLGNGWQGIVSLHGQLHRIEPSRGGRPSQDLPTALPTQPVAKHALDGRCDADHPHLTVMAQEEGDGSTLSGSSTTLSLCDNPVDGICLLPRLVLVFDRQFQQQFPDDYQDQALLLVNIVEGYYRHDMTIAFQHVYLAFPPQELFSSTRDAHDLLHAIKDRYHDLDFFDSNAEIPLLHLVTGRNLHGSTIGVAWTGGACSSNGDASGLSQLINGDSSLTALVAAHEIGHNFAALHDGDHNDCHNGYIMAPQLNSDANHFSHCSQSEMADFIQRQRQPLRCFDYPLDAGIEAHPDNADSIDGSSLTLRYPIHYQDSGHPAEALLLEGQLGSDHGVILAVSLDGGYCQISTDQRHYQCQLDDPQVPSQASVTLAATSQETLRLVQRVSLTGSNIQDINPHNDQLESQLAVTTETLHPQDLSASLDEQSASVTLTWSDVNQGSSDYYLQRQQDQQTWQHRATFPAGSESAEDTGLQANTDYRYRLIAAQGDSGSHSNIVGVRLEDTPEPPTDLSAAQQQLSIQLGWHNPSDFTVSNRVERRRYHAGGVWTKWQDISGKLPAEQEGYSDDTGIAGEHYQYRVMAMNIERESPPSESVAVQLESTQAAQTSTESSGSGGGSALGLALVLVLLRARAQ